MDHLVQYKELFVTMEKGWESWVSKVVLFLLCPSLFDIFPENDISPVNSKRLVDTIVSIMAETPILDKDMVERACTRFLRWVEKVVENEGGQLE